MIKSSANKYKDSVKDSWMKSQTNPVGAGSQIKTTVNLPSFGKDLVTKNVYKGYLGGNKDVIKDAANHRESSHGKTA